MRRIINFITNFFNLNDDRMIPLSENRGYYNDIRCKLGTTRKQWSQKPNIKDPVIAFVGASVPKQIADKVIQLNNTTVQIVNLCVPAQDINSWNDPTSKVWSNAQEVLEANGLTWGDISIVWTMQDDLRDNGDQRFPEAPETLKKKLFRFFEILEAKFPNVKQIDLASRTYNYGADPKHGEPSSYHTGWANKWAVEATRKNPIFINDKCYMWTDGDSSRSDGVSTPISHYKVEEDDLVHYSAEGEDYWGEFVYNYYQQFNWFI